MSENNNSVTFDTFAMSVVEMVVQAVRAPEDNAIYQVAEVSKAGGEPRKIAVVVYTGEVVNVIEGMLKDRAAKEQLATLELPTEAVQ